MNRYSLYKKWNKIRKETGFRSAYEKEVYDKLPDSASYEPEEHLPYSITMYAHYIPDFVLPEQCIVLEAKGQFSKADRDKMLRVKEQYPNLDVRMIFMKQEKITSAMTNVAWCDRHSIPCAVGTEIPKGWLEKKPSRNEVEEFHTLFPSVFGMMGEVSENQQS